jgi:hypothetical protein
MRTPERGMDDPLRWCCETARQAAQGVATRVPGAALDLHSAVSATGGVKVRRST